MPDAVTTIVPVPWLRALIPWAAPKTFLAATIVRSVPPLATVASIPRELAVPPVLVCEPRTVSSAWMVSEPAPALSALMPVLAAVTLPLATILRSVPERATATIPSDDASPNWRTPNGSQTRPSATMVSEPEPALDA